MRAVFGLVLIAGVGLAGFAVMMAKYSTLTQMQLAEAQSLQGQAVPTVEVFRGPEDAELWRSADHRRSARCKWPADAIPEGTFMAMTEIFPENNNAPRFVLRTIEKDEAIMAGEVSACPAKMRASTRGSNAGCAPLRSRSTLPRACRASCAQAIGLTFIRPDRWIRSSAAAPAARSPS